MTLWTPAFQRSENCGDMSPKPHTVSLMVSKRDRVISRDRSNRVVSITASLVVTVRP